MRFSVCEKSVSSKESTVAFLTNFFKLAVQGGCNGLLVSSPVLPKINSRISDFERIILECQESDIDTTPDTVTQSHNGIQYVIDGFLSHNLLCRNPGSGRMYVLGGCYKLRWKNIKSMTDGYSCKVPDHVRDGLKWFFNSDDFVLTVKYLMWYFRKYIVDTILANVSTADVSYKSVGSTKLDSDYDITMYGNGNSIYDTIVEFDKKIYETFKDKSDLVFDTNLYGASFISEGSRVTCNKASFDLVKNSLKWQSPVDTDAYYVSQNIWALIRLFSALEDIRDEDETLYMYIKQKTLSSESEVTKLILGVAEEFVLATDPSIDTYNELVRRIAHIRDRYTGKELMSYISYINYNGIETYFTNGAFIDTVVNAQMCTGTESVPLHTSELFDSIVENLSNQITHYRKIKYITRALSGYDKLVKKPNVDINLRKVKKLVTECTNSLNPGKCSNTKIALACCKSILALTETIYKDLDIGIVNEGIKLFGDHYKKFTN